MDSVAIRKRLDELISARAGEIMLRCHVCLAEIQPIFSNSSNAACPGGCLRQIAGCWPSILASPSAY